jgi:Arc/MetJ family transcription regulator
MALDLDSRIFKIGSMKTTVDLPEDELAEAMKHAKVKTKTEAVALAVADFNRRHRMAALTRHFGTFKDFMTQSDLKRMRESGRHTG